MDRDSIISELFKSKDFNDCISKMEPRHLQDDLRSEVMLILCEKPASVIEEIYSRGQFDLKRYTVAIILNLIKSSTSPFFKKFRNINHLHSILNSDEGERDDDYLFSDPEIEVIELKSRLDEEKKNELRMMEVYNLYWYDQEMIRLYLQNGNYRAIGAKTGISHVSIFNTIKKASHKIDDEVDLRMLRHQPYDFSELMEYISRAQYLESLEYLNNMLDYYQAAYPENLLAEVKRRAKEKEESILSSQPQVNNKTA